MLPIFTSNCSSIILYTRMVERLIGRFFSSWKLILAEPNYVTFIVQIQILTK
jgi:hypothetical protein